MQGFFLYPTVLSVIGVTITIFIMINTQAKSTLAYNTLYNILWVLWLTFVAKGIQPLHSYNWTMVSIQASQMHSLGIENSKFVLTPWMADDSHPEPWARTSWLWKAFSPTPLLLLPWALILVTVVRLSQLSVFAIVYTTLIMKIDIQEWVWKKRINQHKLQTDLSY